MSRVSATQNSINKLLTNNQWVLENPYVASFKPLKIRCNQAHSWSVLPNVLIRDPHCPQCSKETPEEIIANLLTSLEITYETKVSQEELPDKTFDFVLDLDGKVVYIDLDNAASFNQVSLMEEIDTKIEVLSEQEAFLIIIATHLVNLKEDLIKFLKETFHEITEGDYQDIVFFYKAEVYLESTQPKLLNLQNPIVVETAIKADKVDICTRFGLDPKQFTKISENSCIGRELSPTDPRLKIARVYCRVSSVDRSDRSLSASMDLQRQRIQDYAKQNGYHIINVYMDYGITGRKSERRPAFLRMMSDLKPGDTVITVALSRLSRSIVDTYNIIKDMKDRFCRFICFDLPVNLDGSDLTNCLMLNLIACFAEFERKQTSVRVSSALNSLSASGDLRTKPRFGWKKDTTPGINHKEVPFVRDEDEQKVIEFIRGLKLNNPKFTLTEICNILNNSPEGNSRRKANRWYHGTLRRICEANDIPIGECNQSIKNNPGSRRNRQQELE